MTYTAVLDHGYVKLIEQWGSDERIIESARMSTGRGFEGWEKDAKLLAFLYSHKHLTPFEMCGMTIEVKAPLFVFREWHRHRTQSYNEMSARYIPMPDENYMPDVDRIEFLGRQAGNKQSDADKLSIESCANFRLDLRALYTKAQQIYEDALAAGVPKELARLVVPVGRYSRMRASANLRNWLAFLTLRMDPAAQWEIQQYAAGVGKIIEHLFPRTWGLFTGDKND